VKEIPRSEDSAPSNVESFTHINPVVPALAAPVITLDNSTVSWAAVANAAGFSVRVGGSPRAELPATATGFDLAGLTPPLPGGTHAVTVVALGDYVNFSSSPASNAVDFVVVGPSVSEVIVEPANVSVARGATQNFTATVVGTGNPPETVTWAIDGTPVSGTSISAGGLLTVAASDDRLSLTVRATSTFDNTVSGTANVTLTTPAAPGAISVTITGIPDDWVRGETWISFPPSLGDGFFIQQIESPRVTITGTSATFHMERWGNPFTTPGSHIVRIGHNHFSNVGQAEKDLVAGDNVFAFTDLVTVITITGLPNELPGSRWNMDLYEAGSTTDASVPFARSPVSVNITGAEATFSIIQRHGLSSWRAFDTPGRLVVRLRAEGGWGSVGEAEMQVDIGVNTIQFTEFATVISVDGIPEEHIGRLANINLFDPENNERVAGSPQGSGTIEITGTEMVFRLTNGGNFVTLGSYIVSLRILDTGFDENIGVAEIDLVRGANAVSFDDFEVMTITVTDIPDLGSMTQLAIFLRDPETENMIVASISAVDTTDDSVTFRLEAITGGRPPFNTPGTYIVEFRTSPFQNRNAGEVELTRGANIIPFSYFNGN